MTDEAIEALAEQVRQELDNMDYWQGTLKREACIARALRKVVEEMTPAPPRPWAGDEDEKFLALVRDYGTPPGSDAERLIAILDAAHDEVERLHNYCRDAAIDRGEVGQIFAGWYAEGAAAERERIRALVLEWDKLPGPWKLGSIMKMLDDQQSPLPPLPPPSTARKARDKAMAGLHRAIAALERIAETVGLYPEEQSTLVGLRALVEANK